MKKEILKNLNGKSGFTLVELLAVIVVLAVVMLIGVNAVLPQMEKARKNAFAIEANGLIETAQQYYSIKSLEGNNDDVVVPSKQNADTSVIESKGTPVVYSVEELVEHGQSKLNADKYSGKVIIRADEKGQFFYQVFLTNGTYMVYNKGAVIKKDNKGYKREEINANSVKKLDKSYRTEAQGGTGATDKFAKENAASSEPDPITLTK